ncbi:MAG: GGDEF domain-containing protein, partial [Cetobacterium sp.]|uniref:GGDEF domain-containing protein n=1 Tax=Cetobacterium sp. TaxID=2071632 RepID=UPI003F37C4A5
KIKDIFYDNSVISRIGGDEFIIFVESIDNEKTVINKIKTLLTLMNTTYGKNEKNIVISASIGITFIGDECYNFINLYNEADSALYKAKKAGKNCAYVSNEIDNQLIKVNKNSI